MELCAAVLLATTVKQTLAELEYKIDSTYYYTDSKVVLGYIMNESRRFYVYVANRVELIRSLTSPTSWRYVESELNPADIATRGTPSSRIKDSRWLKGPEFLATGTDLPFETKNEDQEVRDVKVRATIKTINDDHIKKYLQDNECQWLWNPPHASHFGGAWERQIQTVRRVLEGMVLDLGRSQLTHDLLVTLMTEASAIVNSRPITAVPSSDDSSDPMPLSPASILTMKSRPYTTVPGVFDKPDLYCQRRWRRVQYLADQFWLRWRRDYLQNQQPRRKWNKNTQNLAVGDIVIIHQDTVRSLWPKGRITKVQPSSDGVVRQVEVEVCEDLMNRKRYTRPATELVLLFRPS